MKRINMNKTEKELKLIESIVNGKFYFIYFMVCLILLFIAGLFKENWSLKYGFIFLFGSIMGLTFIVLDIILILKDKEELEKLNNEKN